MVVDKDRRRDVRVAMVEEEEKRRAWWDRRRRAIADINPLL